MSGKWFKLTARLRDREGFLLWISGEDVRGLWEVDGETVVVYALHPFSPPPPELVRDWTQEEEGERDWEDEWRKGFGTVWVAEDVSVRPPWESETHAPFDLVIYPAFAFGTGHHPTTLWCLRMIRKYLKEGMAFLDVGTGSGILTFLAWKMKAHPLWAIDCDPLAIEEFRRNAFLNGVPLEEVHLLLGGISAARGRFDCIVANVSVHFHLTHLKDLVDLLGEGGHLILSGIESRDFPSLSKRAALYGLSFLEMHEEAFWVTVVYFKRVCYDNDKAR
jgi:ribosomal protein L11 methyltransferase